MPKPASIDEFLDLVRRSGVAEEKRLTPYLDQLRAEGRLPADPPKLAWMLVTDGLLTKFQAENLLEGKWRRFTIGKYKVLEPIGSGGMGTVYLAEHKIMKRRVAVKVLPAAKADDPAALDRFHRESRVVAALDHPNIVRAYDIDQDEKLHFLVMEHVDGASLQEIVKKTGPLDVTRACHYIRQAATGLQHAHDKAAIVHRDIKPGNILVDRAGVVKILDMGLARFFNDEEDVLTRKYDETVLGTADYLAPEQVEDSHEVDIRADVYSLGCTFYFCLTGRAVFQDANVTQKLLWHRTRQPRAVREIRPEVAEELVAVLAKMMAKDREQRYQTPGEVEAALEPWTRTAIPPPPEVEMPQLSPASAAGNSSDGSTSGNRVARPTKPPASPGPKQAWQVVAPAKDTAVAAAPSTPADKPRATPSAAPPGPRPIRPTAPRPVSPAKPAAAAVPAMAKPAAVKVPAPVSAPAAPRAQLAPDTREGLAATPDTGPPAPRVQPTRPTSPRDDRNWVVWVVLAGGLAVALGGGFIAYQMGQPKDAPPKTEPEKVPPVLTVGPDGTYRKLSQAVSQAAPGSVIQLDADLTEQLTLDGRSRRNLTIQAAPGQRIVWKAPATMAADQRLLWVSGADGLTVKGLTFDGADRLNEVVLVAGRCPALTFEEIEVRNFKKAGVLLANAAGTKERPIRLLNCVFRAPSKLAAAIAFHIDDKTDPPTNQFCQLRDLTFEGPGVKVRTRRLADLENVELPAGVTATPTTR